MIFRTKAEQQLKALEFQKTQGQISEADYATKRREILETLTREIVRTYR